MKERTDIFKNMTAKFTKNYILCFPTAREFLLVSIVDMTRIILDRNTNEKRSDLRADR